METKSIIINGLDFSHLGFLVWLYKKYGTLVTGTYKEIANQTGCLSYGSVRLYLLSLAQTNYIEIENRGKWRQIYHLNEERIKLYLNGR